MQSIKADIILHACCAPCSTYVIEKLSPFYKITALFFNPNIQPADEYKKRLYDMEKLCELKKTELVVLDYEVDSWMERIKGLEDADEGGSRCRLCFDFRLSKAAGVSAQKGVELFATTLTVSPYKNADIINATGSAVAHKFGLRFLENDFKKKDGYRKSCELSREYDLYRQKYCGCIYSMGLKK